VLSVAECQHYERVALDQLGADCARWLAGGAGAAALGKAA
jgi:hypothetical protein